MAALQNQLAWGPVCPRVLFSAPLLFLTYIDDLPSTVSSQVRLFADDCLLYRLIKCRADQEQLQRDLFALQDWADRWGMCFNPFEMLGPEGVHAKIKKPGIWVHP